MHTTLQKFMKIGDIERNEWFLAYIIREITAGLEEFHKQHIIHRDIKGDNIFIDDKGGIKIGDFGLSAQLTLDRETRNTFAGSPLWMAPEIIWKSPYNTSSDIWSLGILAYELAEGRTPYDHCRSVYELGLYIRATSEPRISEHWSENFKDFIRKCLQKNPDARETSTSLLNSNFLREISERSAREYIIDKIRS